MIDLTFVAEIKAFEILVQSVFQIQGVLLRKILNKYYIFIVHFIVFIGLGRFFRYSWNLRTATPNIFFHTSNFIFSELIWSKWGAVYTSFLLLILSLSCSSGRLHTHTLLPLSFWYENSKKPKEAEQAAHSLESCRLLLLPLIAVKTEMGTPTGPGPPLPFF